MNIRTESLTIFSRFAEAVLQITLDHNLFADVPECIGNGASRCVAAEYMAHVLPCYTVTSDISEIPIE